MQKINNDMLDRGDKDRINITLHFRCNDCDKPTKHGITQVQDKTVTVKCNGCGSTHDEDRYVRDEWHI